MKIDFQRDIGASNGIYRRKYETDSKKNFRYDKFAENDLNGADPRDRPSEKNPEILHCLLYNTVAAFYLSILIFQNMWLFLLFKIYKYYETSIVL